jgi:hypothetical protein
VTRSRGPDLARIRAFLRTREREGRRGAAAFAASGVEVLFDDREGTGPRDVASLGALVARVFPSGAPNDVRTSFAELLDPVPRRIEETTGVALDALVPRWERHLATLRADAALGNIVDPLAALEADTIIEPDASPTIVVRATIPPGTTLTVRHLEAGPFDHPVTDFDLHAESAASVDGVTEVRVVGAYGPRSRVILATDLIGTALRVPLRLDATRLELP